MCLDLNQSSIKKKYIYKNKRGWGVFQWFICGKYGGDGEIKWSSRRDVFHQGRAVVSDVLWTFVYLVADHEMPA